MVVVVDVVVVVVVLVDVVVVGNVVVDVAIISVDPTIGSVESTAPVVTGSLHRPGFWLS